MIGYWCRVSAQGQGYVTEAARAVTRAAFEVMEAGRVEIICDARNEKSKAVAERVGYVFEARLRRHKRAPDGFLRDTLIYTMLAEDWATLAASQTGR